MRQRISLLVSVSGAMLVALDGTVLTVAQPSLRRDLGASLAQVQWTSTAYLLAVAAFLVVAGGWATGTGTRGCSSSACWASPPPRPASCSRPASAG